MKEYIAYPIYAILLTVFFYINKTTEDTFASEWSWFWVFSPIWGLVLVTGLSITAVKIFCYYRDKALMEHQQKESGIGKRTMKKRMN